MKAVISGSCGGAEPPVLMVQIRERNQRKGKNESLYHCEKIELPWEIAAKLAEFISAGPWYSPARFRRKGVDA